MLLYQSHMCSKIELLFRNTRENIETSRLRWVWLVALAGISLAAAACAPNTQVNTSTNTATANTQPAANTNVAQAQPAAPADNTPITLPVIDAMFADESFAGDLKSNVGLTDDQVSKLQQTARDAVLKLDESDENASTTASVKKANDAIKKIVGGEKAKQVVDFVRQRWAGSDQGSMLNRPNAVPTDSRIVINAPAYRMDVFRDGKLEKSYKVGIGYPEFPLPRGMRQAKTIIFNPAWTPPDEPWVKGKFAPGKKVEAGSKDNPLGPIKIPIGLPSLIHGGKNPAKLGTFASHGCVGLTNQGIEDFAQKIAQLSGDNLTPQDIKTREEDRSKTQEMKLQDPVPVELRYETIVVEDGKVHIYRDVYELGTNTEDDLRKVLSAYDVDFDQLDPNVKKQLMDALQSMAVDAKGNPVDENDNKDSSSGSKSKKSGKITTTIKGKKEIVVDVPQLAGKGYPDPVDLMG
jgi:lipoprotein-anchoring transpeptidase ErfK/SrfK